MRNTLKLSCLLVLLCGTLVASGQDILNTIIAIPDSGLTVEQYLTYIEKSSTVKLSYSSAILYDRKIKLSADSISLRYLLDTLFAGRNIHYIEKNNLLVLSPQPKDQLTNAKIKVSGVIRNAKGDSPIPFASIFVQNESIGTIANSEGAFELFLPEDSAVDSLTISCLGYLQQKIGSQIFLKGPLTVLLLPNKFQIDELIVRPENPTELLNGAIRNRNKNYGTEPSLLKAFFREATRQDEKYISLSEAIIDIYKAAYNSENEDLVKLQKGRKGDNIQETELVNLVVEGGLYNSMHLDVVKYQASFLDPEYYANYDYKLEKLTSYRGKPTYVIDFKFKGNIASMGFDGKIYLDVKSLAITRAEFKISEEGLHYAHSIIIKKIPPGYEVKPRSGIYEVDYREYNNLWHLAHARSEIDLKVRKKRGVKNKGFNCQFVSTSEYVVTGTSSEGFEKIKYREASKPRDILLQQITSTDANFWGTENTILPEEPLQNTLDKLMIGENEVHEVLSTKPISGDK